MRDVLLGLAGMLVLRLRPLSPTAFAFIELVLPNPGILELSIPNCGLFYGSRFLFVLALKLPPVFLSPLGSYSS